MIGRRGFLGGLIALPFAAKALEALPAPAVAAIPVAPTATVGPPIGLQAFMIRTASPQNVGTWSPDVPLPVPPSPVSRQAYYNAGTSTLYIQAGDKLMVLAPGKSYYRDGDRLVPCKNPRWAAP